MFGIRIECFLRGKHYGRSDIAVRKRHERCFSEVTTNLGKRAYEALEVTDTVAYRKIREAVSEVAEFHLDIVFITKKVIDLDAGKSYRECVDDELGLVKIGDRLAVDELRTDGVIAADTVDLFSGVLGHLDDFVEQFFSVKSKSFTGKIEARKEKVRTGSRLCQVDDLADIGRGDQRSFVLLTLGATDQKEGALCQGSAGLMHRNSGHIRTGLHRGNGKLLRERKMRAVRFVDDDLHAVGMREFYDAADVTADTVVGRIVDEDGFRVGILKDRFFHVGELHAESDAQLLMGARIDIDRDGAAQDHRVDDASVDISRDDDLIASGRDGKYHCLNGRGRAANHKESGSCSKCFRRELLGFLNDGDRVAEVVQGLHGIDVERHGALA